MENTIFKCLGCGNGLESGKAVDGLVTCDFCGMKRTVPKQEVKPAALTYLMLAERDLELCEFDKAYAGYLKAAEADGEEPEAYFGMALAQFKVQYLKDMTANKARLQPICHEITEKKFSENKNYRKALSLSTGSRRAKYEEQAKEIDYINREFFHLKEQGAKYDCFLCVKVTAEDGGHTEDSHTALTLYHELRKAGYAPFYSEEEIRGRTGADYEALILYALWSSRCMLVVCSNEEYLQTPWVKNEYTRFIKMMREDDKEDRSIAIVFGGTPLEKLAGVQGRIQGIPFKSFDALDRIRTFVDRFTLRDAPELTRKDYGNVTYQKKSVVKKGIEKRRLTMAGGGEVSVSDQAKLNIAGEFLSRRDFSAAIRFCDQLTAVNPQNCEAYWIRFLAEHACCNEEKILESDDAFSDFASLEKAIATAQDKDRRKKFYRLLSERVKIKHDFNCYREYIELPESEEKVIAELTEIIYSDALREKNRDKFDAALKTVGDSERYIKMNLTFARALGEDKAHEYYKNILKVDEGHGEALWFAFEGETAGKEDGVNSFCLSADHFPALEEKLFAYGFNGFAADKLFGICMETVGNAAEQSAALFDFLLGMIPKEENERFTDYDEKYVEKLFVLKKTSYANKYNELLLQTDPYNHGAHFNRCLIKRGLSNPLGLLADTESLLEDENYFAAINCYAEKFPDRENFYLNMKDTFNDIKSLLKNCPECLEFIINNCYVTSKELPDCYSIIKEALLNEGTRIYRATLTYYGCSVAEELFFLRRRVSDNPEWKRALNYVSAAGDSDLKGILNEIISTQSKQASKNFLVTTKKTAYILFVASSFIMSVSFVVYSILASIGISPFYEFNDLIFPRDSLLTAIGSILTSIFLIGIIWSIFDLRRKVKKGKKVIKVYVFLAIMLIISLTIYIIGGIRWNGI